VRITSITPQDRDPGRVNLFVDGEFRAGLAAEVAREMGFRAGTELDEAALRQALDADEEWRAREAALTLLGYRARSAAELRRRLLRKQFSSTAVDRVVEALAERGHVDDDAFAEAFARDRARSRPRGRGRLVNELRARGVATEAAARAVDAVFRSEQVSEEMLARSAAEAWLRKGGAGRSGPDARRRLRAYLARRGFFGESARAAVQAVLPDR
jgi:regulatory protein